MSKRSNRDRQLQKKAPATLIAQSQQLRIAPLPTPRELAEFDAVVPGLAERVVKMAEENGVDRRRNNRTIRWISVLGQVFAFVAVMTALGGGFYMVGRGQDVAGVAAIVTAIAAPLSVFTWNRTRRQS